MLPIWLVSVIIVGICTAAGAGIGALLERKGHSYGRWASLVGLVAGLTVAGTGIPRDIQSLTVTEASVEGELLKSDMALYPYLKEHFPSDYSEMLTGIVRIVRQSTDRSTASIRGGELVAAIRRKYATQIQFAPDELIKRNMERTAQLHSAVLERAGPDLCAEFAANGGVALARAGKAALFRQEVSELGLLYFQAVRAAITEPVQRPTVVDADWLEVAEAMDALGADEATFATLETSSAIDPKLCPAIIIMLNAIVGLQSEAGERVRASMMVDLAGS